MAWVQHIFLSTPSARRATRRNGFTTGKRKNFYPRPPRGGRLSDVLELKTAQLFLSTPSARRATQQPYHGGPEEAISIHALREEGDLALVQIPCIGAGISIHALREEGDG